MRYTVSGSLDAIAASWNDNAHLEVLSVQGEFLLKQLRKFT